LILLIVFTAEGQRRERRAGPAGRLHRWARRASAKSGRTILVRTGKPRDRHGVLGVYQAFANGKGGWVD